MLSDEASSMGTDKSAKEQAKMERVIAAEQKAVENYKSKEVLKKKQMREMREDIKKMQKEVRLSNTIRTRY